MRFHLRCEDAGGQDCDIKRGSHVRSHGEGDKPGKRFDCDQSGSRCRHGFRPESDCANSDLGELQGSFSRKRRIAEYEFVTLPVGSNERFVVQAEDSKGTIAKVVDSITVK